MAAGFAPCPLNDVGTVSGSEALLLRDTDRLRFVPDGLNGNTASVTFCAWDQTCGAAATKVDASASGGTTAFSTAAATSSMTIRGANSYQVVTARGGSELLLEPIADQLMLDAVFSTKSDVFSLWPDKRGNSDEGAASEPLDDDTSADGSSSQQADGKIDVPDAFWLVIAPLLAAGIINRIPQMKMTRVSSLEPNEPAKAGV